MLSLPVPARPGTRTFLQVPDPSRPEVKNPYPSDPAGITYSVIIKLHCALLQTGHLETVHAPVADTVTFFAGLDAPVVDTMTYFWGNHGSRV